MKITELKVGDEIKYKEDNISYQGKILNIWETVLEVSKKLIRKDQVISKLESIFREIPIEEIG